MLRDNDKISCYLEEYDKLNDAQHGFRKGRSCFSALLNVFDNILNYLSEHKATCVDMVYFDYAKVFDKEDHGILLHKIRDFGITAYLGIWLAIYQIVYHQI